MGHKRLMFSTDAREKILRGATADAVRVTLGPKSRGVLIAQKWGNPIVCDDGVTIAKALDLQDPEENLGARMIRQAAERTGDVVGDGTTTSALLAHAIFAEGLRNVVAGASAVDLKRGLDRGVAVIRVGAPSEAELKKRKEAFDDAISATRAALTEGIVPGAGLALLRAADAVGREEASAEGDERTGLAILRRALEAPTRQLAENSGVDGGMVIDRMRAGLRGRTGLTPPDAPTSTYAGGNH